MLAVADVARELQVTEPTVRQWIRARALRASRLGVGGSASRTWRVTRSDLDEFKLRRDAPVHRPDGPSEAGEKTEDLNAEAAAIVERAHMKAARRGKT